MSQTFLDYNGQVDKLINEKQLIVADRSYAIGHFNARSVLLSKIYQLRRKNTLDFFKQLCD